MDRAIDEDITADAVVVAILAVREWTRGKKGCCGEDTVGISGSR